MSKEILYVIIYCIGAISLYTAVIFLGIYRAKREGKNTLDYLFEVKHILEEIRQIIMKEEISDMSEEKGQYKSVRDSEMLSVGEVAKPLHFPDLAGKLTLSDLINRKPTEENYADIINLLAELFQKTYGEYKFMVAKAQKEYDANFLQVVSRYEEHPELHKSIFRKAIDYGIEMRTLQEKFAAHVAAGKVLNLGPDVVVITDDGTISLPTGVSPINSGLEGGEISAIVTFIHKDHYEDWAARNINPKEA